MKSRVLQVKDYRTVDLKGWIKPFVLDEAALEREFQRLTNPYIRWEPGTQAVSGDLVTCRLASECPRFQKDRVRFAAGSGMFHPVLENLSVGMSVEETRNTELPEGKVTLTVLEVTRRVVPEPTDEMAVKLGLEGVSDLASYRAYLTGQQKEKYLEEASYEPMQRLAEAVLVESEFVLFKEDWAAAVAQKLERSRTLCRQEGLVLEEMTPEQFNGRIPVKSYYEFVAMLQEDAWDILRMHLLGKYYAQTDGFTVSEADYEAYIADYVKSWHTTAERAREVDPYDSFVFGEYINHAYHVLRTYVKQLF